MKTKFFRKTIQRRTILSRVARLFCLLLLLTATFCAAAQNGITLSGFVMDAGTVTFNVSWKNTGMPAIWSDTVWVWVDYNTAGTMTRLPLSTGATLTTHTAPDDVGKVMEVSGNDKGVWVVGNARSAGSFSATVRLLTATATAAAACVYASNYQPVGQYTTATNITFRGTRPHDVLLKHTNGSSTVTQVAGGSLTIPAGYTLQSFTDKTGAPGVITCTASAVYDLKASATEFCTGSTVTFALSNTTAGRTYQLYKGSTLVNMLTGTGGAATFTGAFAGAGIYTAQVVTENGYCAAAMNGTHTVSVTTSLPAAPTGASSNARCGSGAVTFSATAPGGCTIDWYTTQTGSTLVSGGSGVTLFAPTIYANTTYHAQARNTSTGCVSASRLAVSGTINSVPTISRSGGAASQSVNQNTAISTITYTASNATTIYRSSGSFPTGVTGSVNGTVFTISGTPSATGTFGYSVSSSHTNGCVSGAATGSIIVNAMLLPNTASTKTWVIGSLTWSDQLVTVPTNCTKICGTCYSTSPAYSVEGNNILYNAYCLDLIQSTLCPTPWRLPTCQDANTYWDNSSYWVDKFSAIMPRYCPDFATEGSLSCEWSSYVWLVDLTLGDCWATSLIHFDCPRGYAGHASLECFDGTDPGCMLPLRCVK